MKTKKVDRFGHAGKSWHEKEAYKNFLAAKFYLDKTESEPVDTNKTDESSFEEEKIEPTKIQKKSKWLKARDFLYDNWVVSILGGIISGVILLTITGYISVNKEQGIQGEKILGIEKSIEEIKKDNKENLNNFNLLKEGFNVFKAEVSKDLEFIRNKLKF